jgi:predicted MFS family arabinose efflux permease
MIESAQRPNPWRTVTAAVFALAVGAGTLNNFVWGSLIKVMGPEFHWDRSTVSLGISMYLLGIAGSTPFYGAIIDRWGIRIPALISLGLFVIPLLVMSAITELWQYYVAFLAMGIVSGGVASITWTKAITSSFRERRGLALGLASVGLGLGGLILPALTTVTLTHYGWRQGFIGLAILITLVSFPALCFGLAGVPHVRRPKGQQSAAIRHLSRNRSLWLIVITVALITSATIGLLVHGVPLMTDRGLTPGKAAAVLSAVAITSVLGRVAGGYLLDLYFAPRIVAGVYFIAAVGAVLITIGGSGVLLVVGYICVGLAMGVESDANGYLVSRYCPQADFGKAYSAVLLTFSASNAVSAYLMGLCYDLTHSYVVGTAIVAVLAALASITVLRLGPYVSDTVATSDHATSGAPAVPELT